MRSVKSMHIFHFPLSSSPLLHFPTTRDILFLGWRQLLEVCLLSLLLFFLPIPLHLFFCYTGLNWNWTFSQCAMTYGLIPNILEGDVNTSNFCFKKVIIYSHRESRRLDPIYKNLNRCFSSRILSISLTGSPLIYKSSLMSKRSDYEYGGAPCPPKSSKDPWRMTCSSCSKVFSWNLSERVISKISCKLHYR